MPIRPEAEQKLRAGFQRRVDRQAERYVAQLTHAEQLAVRLECGQVAGVFTGQAGGDVRRGTYAVGLLPLAAAFAEGYAFLDGPQADALYLRWSEVTEVGEVWANVYDVSAEESRPRLTAYQLRCADGRTCEISRSLINVRDPYPGVGSLVRGVMPADVGATMPKFPTIDEVIAAFAGKPPGSARAGG